MDASAGFLVRNIFTSPWLKSRVISRVLPWRTSRPLAPPTSTIHARTGCRTFYLQPETARLASIPRTPRVAPLLEGSGLKPPFRRPIDVVCVTPESLDSDGSSASKFCCWTNLAIERLSTQVPLHRHVASARLISKYYRTNIKVLKVCQRVNSVFV